MNRQNNCLYSRLRLVATATLILSVQSVFAQTTAQAGATKPENAPDKEVVVLSPFQVSSEAVRG